jgi:hypothetical protein
MKINDWRRKARRRAWTLVLLSLALVLSCFSFPEQLTAAGIRAAVSKNTVPGLKMAAAEAPETLKSFIQLTIETLAKEEPFKAWTGSQVKFYPLGPGTHGWLVHVMKGEQRMGYMIITAKEEGGYVLTEYGAGNDGLPYSMSDLRQYLVQEGLIPSNYSGTLTLIPLYSPLLPLWEIKLAGKKLYINAAQPEILPWDSKQAEAMLQKKIPAALGSISNGDMPATSKAYLVRPSSFDPYDNLLWLKNPELPRLDGEAFIDLIKRKGSMVFQSAGENDKFGAPFMITGYQKWTEDIVYAAVGPKGLRFVPLPVLQDNGTLHMAASE